MTVPNPGTERTYPVTASADGHRFTLGVVFDVAKVLAEHGYPPITAGGDLVALQQALYGFLYAPPPARKPVETAAEWGYPPRTEDVNEIAARHVVHQCCGKLDDGPHENYCEHYRSPEQKLREYKLRHGLEDAVRYEDRCPDGGPHLWVGGRCDACGATTEGGAR